MAEILFWFFLVLIFYTYLGYPFLIFALGVLLGKRVQKKEIHPSITFIITAYNEEKTIREKIENTLSLNYPKDKLEILLASDGSTDRTESIASRYSKQGVQVLRVEGRVGKTETQNLAVAKASGDILVFSDAASLFGRDALKMIVRNFWDPEVGGVAGRCEYIPQTSDARPNLPTRIYWCLENLIKKNQSRLLSLTGASGLIYAVRKRNYVSLPADIISDMVEPMMIVKLKKRFVFEPRAVAYEQTTRYFRHEFQMRVRTIARGMAGIIFARDLLNPLRRPWISLQILSHKIMRWLLPFYLTCLFVSNVILVTESTLFQIILLFQCILYAFAILSIFYRLKGKLRNIQDALVYVLILSYASLVAIIKVARGTVPTTWEPNRK